MLEVGIGYYDQFSLTCTAVPSDMMNHAISRIRPEDVLPIPSVEDDTTQSGGLRAIKIPSIQSPIIDDRC